jgi:hypothetical protein
LFLGISHYLSTHSVYIKCVGCNIKDVTFAVL